VQFYAYLDPTSAQAQQEKLLAGWHTLHPTIPVEIILQPGSTVDAITKLTTLVASGTPPDVLMDLGTGRNLSQLQLVQSLDDLIGRDKTDTAAVFHVPEPVPALFLVAWAVRF